MENIISYFASISNKEQKADKQIELFKALCENERDIIVDKESRQDTNRAGYLVLKIIGYVLEIY